jgi:hypothetical protein
MSERGVLPAMILGCLLVVLLGGCTPFGIDVHDRISLFAKVLNAEDRSTINEQFDQSATQNLSTMDATWWDINFPSPPDTDHAYSITLLDYSEPTAVVAVIRGPPAFNSNTGAPVNAVFAMTQEGSDWFIWQIYLNGNSTPLIQ